MQRIPTILCHYFLIIFRWPRSAVVVDGCLEHPVVKWILCFPQELGKWEFCMADRRNRNGWRGRGGQSPFWCWEHTALMSCPYPGKKRISKKCRTSDRPPKWVSLLTWFHFLDLDSCATLEAYVCGLHKSWDPSLPPLISYHLYSKETLTQGNLETQTFRKIFNVVYKASFIQPRCSY